MDKSLRQMMKPSGPHHPKCITRPTSACVTAGFEFDVPVRFDTDDLKVDLDYFEVGLLPNNPIIEIKV